MLLLDIPSWWQELSTPEKLYWAVALLFSLLFASQTILSLVHRDEEKNRYTPQIMNVRNVIAFCCVAGWTGVALLAADIGLGTATLLSLAAGAMAVVLIWFLQRSLQRVKADPGFDIQQAIGKIGEVNVPVPAHLQGQGEVHIKIQGSVREIPAVSADEQSIAAGKLVKVLSVQEKNVLVVTTHLAADLAEEPE
jgi:membrane protein implicated in regulation of membrane protease activity